MVSRVFHVGDKETIAAWASDLLRIRSVLNDCFQAEVWMKARNVPVVRRKVARSQEGTGGEQSSQPLTPTSRPPSISRLSRGDTREPVEPTYEFHLPRLTDSLAREDDDLTHPTGSTRQSANPSVTVGLGVLPPPNNTPTRAPQPQTVLPTPNPSTLVDLEVPACRRLLSRAFLPHEFISQIEETFTRKDEVKVIGCLERDEAQAFIDVVHEVRPTLLHLCNAV